MIFTLNKPINVAYVSRMLVAECTPAI